MAFFFFLTSQSSRGRLHSLFVFSMTKARKLGWTGYIDTWDAYLEVFGELERQKIIPKVTGITA